VGWAAILWTLQGSLCPDVVTLNNGHRLEGLVVEVNDLQIRLRWGNEGIALSEEIPRKHITEIQLAPPEISGFRTVAARLESDRSVDLAIDALRELCALRPESLADQVKLARLLSRAGRLEEADLALEATERVAPGDPRVTLERGEVALLRGDGPETVKHAREHQKRAGCETPQGLWLLARGLEKSDLAADAMGEYRKLLRSDPRKSEAMVRFTALALRENRSQEVVTEAERVCREAPDLRAGWMALGTVHYLSGRYAEAVSSFRSATGPGGDGYNRARVYFQCSLARRYGRDPRAVLTESDFLIAQELDPELRRQDR
jgi:cytochrome c-type biogenesis protein CcmH/NrfG